MVKSKKGSICVILLIIIYLCYIPKVVLQNTTVNFKYNDAYPKSDDYVCITNGGNTGIFLNNICKKTWGFANLPSFRTGFISDNAAFAMCSIIPLSLLVSDKRKRIMEQNTVKFNGSKYKDGASFL